MAPKPKSGVAQYVASKNLRSESLNSHAALHDLEDLKVIPNRSGAHISGKRASDGNLKSLQNTHRPSRSSDQGRHDDTDASLADMTSNSSGIKKGNVTGAESPKGHLANDDDDNEFGHDSGSEMRGRGIDVDHVQQPDHGDATRQAPIASKPDSEALGRVSGDSYPETTSGQPSEADTNMLSGGHKTALLEPMANPLPSRGVQRHVAGNMNPSEEPQSLANGLHDIASGFQFVDGRQHKQHMWQPKQHNIRQASSVPLPTHQKRAKYPSLPGHVRTVNSAAQESSLTNGGLYVQDQSQQAQPELQQQQHRGRQHESRSRALVEGDQLPEEARKHDKQRDRDRSMDEPLVEQSPEQDLDYSPTTLFSKDFTELRTESFDQDARSGNAHPLHLPANNSLHSNLEFVAGLEPQAKADFFAGLAIDEWEEAGGWFLDRFRDILQKLTHARREKRGAAQQFEDEIEQRHKAVKRKREETDEALKQMKQSGLVLLQGTPTKARKLE